MITIRQIDRPEQKADICSRILHVLPEWFGIEAAIADYTEKSKAMHFQAAFDGEEPIGFIALKAHNQYTSEIEVMGVLKKYHRHGIGKQLVEACVAFCSEQHVEFLTVKTLDASAPSDDYEKTRKFYYAAGFRPLEMFPLHWDKNNPCLFMARAIAREEK